MIKSIHKDTQQLVQDSAVIKDRVALLPDIRDQIDELREQIQSLPTQLVGCTNQQRWANPAGMVGLGDNLLREQYRRRCHVRRWR